MPWVPKGPDATADGVDADEDAYESEDSSAGKRGWKGKGKGEDSGRKGGCKGGKKGKGSSKAGGKGAGKAGGKGGGKGGDHGDAADHKERSERAERTNRSEDAKRQAAVQKGKYVEVRKHSSMGCAVVTMKDMRVRQAILNAGLEATIAGIHVKLKPHFEKDTRKEVMTDLFVGWGRQAEKATPLPEAELVHFFDQKHEELCNSGCLDELARGAPQQAPVKDVQSEQQQMPMVPDAAIVAVVRGNTQGAPPAGAAAPPHMQTPVPAAVPQQPLQAQQAQEAQQAQQHAAMMQAAQAQWHAQMQAQWAAQWAAHAQMQQQQHQQALAYAAAMANPPAAPGKGQRREFKPAYRRPTDEEIQAQFKSVVALPKAQDTTPHVTDEQILAKVRSVIAPGKAQGSAPGAEQAPGQDVSEGGC